MFSKTCEYALQAVLYIQINSENNNFVPLANIAESQNIPLHFLSKILQKLVKKKILRSIKGPSGGFIVTEDPKNIFLIDIIKEIDGLEIFDRCVIGLKKCQDKNPCPIHHDYKPIKKRIKNLLQNKSLYDLCTEVKSGKSIITLM